MRIFVALEIPEDIRAAFAEAQERLNRAEQRVKWTDPSLIHLTIKFIGEVRDADVGDIAQAVERCASEAEPTLLAFRGVGAFPRPDRPRIVWIGGVDATGALGRLHDALDRALAAFGAKREARAFRAHATIGRVRRPRPMPDLARAIERMSDKDFGDVEAAEVVLMQSELAPSGPAYTPLSRHRLGDSARNA